MNRNWDQIPPIQVVVYYVQLKYMRRRNMFTVFKLGFCWRSFTDYEYQSQLALWFALVIIIWRLIRLAENSGTNRCRMELRSSIERKSPFRLTFRRSTLSFQNCRKSSGSTYQARIRDKEWFRCHLFTWTSIRGPGRGGTQEHFEFLKIVLWIHSSMKSVFWKIAGLGNVVQPSEKEYMPSKKNSFCELSL